MQYIPLARRAAACARAAATPRPTARIKGDASYYHVVTAGGAAVDDAIWTYEQPYPAVAAIAGHVAFYPDKADISRIAGYASAPPDVSVRAA